jgi:hypothetical protein
MAQTCVVAREERGVAFPARGDQHVANVAHRRHTLHDGVRAACAASANVGGQRRWHLLGPRKVQSVGDEPAHGAGGERVERDCNGNIANVPQPAVGTRARGTLAALHRGELQLAKQPRDRTRAARDGIKEKKLKKKKKKKKNPEPRLPSRIFCIHRRPHSANESFTNIQMVLQRPKLPRAHSPVFR